MPHLSGSKNVVWSWAGSHNIPTLFSKEKFTCFVFLCVWVWQLDQMERWTRAVTASVDGVLGLSLVSHKTFCNQTIYLWNHWDYKMLKYCIKLLLGAIDLYFTINEIIIKAMPYNKWKFSILTCKQVYVKNYSTKGASGKCWRKRTRGGGGVSQMLTIADKGGCEFENFSTKGFYVNKHVYREGNLFRFDHWW